jgi:hypothetical protein
LTAAQVAAASRCRARGGGGRPGRAARPALSLVGARLIALIALFCASMLGPVCVRAQRSSDSRMPQPWLAPPVGSLDSPAMPWRVVGLPQQSMPLTRFSVLTLDGRRVLRVEAQASYGNLVHALAGVPESVHRLSWRWRLDEPNPAADLRRKDGDDSAIKVCALFDLPLSALPFGERQWLRLARLSAGETLPSASVCYVWDNRLPPGTVLDNAFTRRVRTIVLRGPEAPLRGWLDEQRDVAADFLRLFGDEAKTLPALIGVAIGADADNTQARSLAFLAEITLD